MSFVAKDPLRDDFWPLSPVSCDVCSRFRNNPKKVFSERRRSNFDNLYMRPDQFSSRYDGYLCSWGWTSKIIRLLSLNWTLKANRTSFWSKLNTVSSHQNTKENISIWAASGGNGAIGRSLKITEYKQQEPAKDFICSCVVCKHLRFALPDWDISGRREKKWGRILRGW